MISIFLFTFTFSWSIIIPKVVICIKNFTLKSFLALFCSLTFRLNSSAMEENKLKTNTNNGNKNENIIYGGIDAEEVLSDGTKLIFVSGKNIESAYKKYKAEAEEIYSKRWPLETRRNIKNGSIFASALTVAGSLPFILNKKYFLKGIATAGTVLTASLGTYAYSYFRDKNIVRDYGCSDFVKDYNGNSRWGFERIGPAAIAADLWLFSGYPPALKDGVVIIIRPKNKHGYGGVVMQNDKYNPFDKIRKNLEESIEKGL